MREQVQSVELITDIALLMLFVGLFGLISFKANFTSVHPLFGVAMILLLATNFVEFGGVQGNVRFNYYAGFFVIILLYSGRPQVALLLLQIVLLIGLVIYTGSIQSEVAARRAAEYSGVPNFLFTLAIIGIFSFYLKSIAEFEVNRLSQLGDQLRGKVAEAKTLNQQLVKGGQALGQAQQHLETEVQRRTASLIAKQKAIEKYIHLNTQVLQEPMSKLNGAIHNFKTPSPLFDMLQVSHAELLEVLKSITSALEAEEKLNRTKIK